MEGVGVGNLAWNYSGIGIELCTELLKKQVFTFDLMKQADPLLPL
jgi:hypothetical protein